MPGDRRQILSLLRLPIPPLQRTRNHQSSMRQRLAQPRIGKVWVAAWISPVAPRGRSRFGIQQLSSVFFLLDWGTTPARGGLGGRAAIFAFRKGVLFSDYL